MKKNKRNRVDIVKREKRFAEKVRKLEELARKSNLHVTDEQLCEEDTLSKIIRTPEQAERFMKSLKAIG